MAILAVGALSIDYIRWHWVEPIRSSYHANFFDVSLLLNAQCTRFAQAYLLRIIKKNRPVNIFFYSDAIQSFFTDDFFEQVRANGVRVIAFHADDDPDVWFNQNRIYDHRYDWIYSPSSRGVERRLKAGVRHVSYLPWGYNAVRFPQLEPMDEVYDVVFVGTNLVHEANPSQYFRDGDSRQKLLVDLYHICRQHGVRLSLFGYGWDRHPLLRDCYGGFPSHSELQQIYRQTRILFNPGFTADDNFDWQTKLRHFEVAGSGVFQLVNENPELAALFTPGEEIVFYHDLPDLERQILRYLPDRHERRRIASNAAKKATEQHVTQRRLEQMFGPADPHQSVNKQPVQTFFCKDRSELLQLRQKLLAKEIIFVANICQVIAGPVQLANHELSVMPPDWQDMQVDAWGVRSYLQLGSRNANLLQRKTQDIQGILLAENMDGRGLGWPLFKRLTEDLPGIWYQDRFYPLCNFLIRAEHLLDVISAILADDGDAWRQFRIRFTGRVVNDLRLLSHSPLPTLVGDYPELLRQLLAQCQISGERLLIYGVRGEMADQVFKILTDYTDLNIAGLVDRGMAGKNLGNWLIHSPDEIEQLRPDFILITAESSGPQIQAALTKQGFGELLLPLYDTQAMIWQLILP
jgi:hypothetical protein